MTTTTQPIAFVTRSFAADRRWNQSLIWQIRCNSATFNGTLFATKAEADAFVATLMTCGCGLIVRQGAPHLSSCPSVAP